MRLAYLSLNVILMAITLSKSFNFCSNAIISMIKEGRARGGTGPQALTPIQQVETSFINAHHQISLPCFLHMMRQPLHDQVATVTGF